MVGYSVLAVSSMTGKRGRRPGDAAAESGKGSTDAQMRLCWILIERAHGDAAVEKTCSAAPEGDGNHGESNAGGCEAGMGMGQDRGWDHHW